MQVPRGLRREDGSFARSYGFRPLTGAVELEAVEAVSASSRPEAVANILSVMLAHIGGNPVDRDVVQMLPLGDMRVMMASLARHVGAERQWLTSTCAACGAPFDFALSPGDLPAPKEPAAELDRVEVLTGSGPVLVRAPLCSDQLAIAGVPDPERALVERCVAPVRADGMIRLEFDEADLAAIDQAMIALSPTLPFGAAASCPACGELNELPICTSDWLDEMGEGPLQDVHDIASAYGWGEDGILALSRQRRKAYLRLIDEDRGIMSGRA